jgi:hypothetical protein
MLGTNDLKPVFNRTPMRIAIGAAHLIDLVNTLNGGVGTNYKNPKVFTSHCRIGEKARSRHRREGEGDV